MAIDDYLNEIGRVVEERFAKIERDIAELQGREPAPTPDPTPAPDPTPTPAPPTPVPIPPPQMPEPGDTYVVPDVIPADGRPVETELHKFFADVPDGATITFPPGGTYGHDRSLTIGRTRRNLTIDGRGVTFQKTSVVTPGQVNSVNPSWKVVGAEGITLRNLVIRGTYKPTPHGTPGQGLNYDHGVALWGTKDCTVENVVTFNNDGDGLCADPDIEAAQDPRIGGDYSKVNPCRNTVIRNFKGRGAGRQGLAATAFDGFRVEGADIADCQQNSIDLEIDHPGVLARHAVLLDVTVADFYFAALAIPLGSFPGEEAKVFDFFVQRFRTLTHSDTCYPAMYFGDDRTRLRDLVVADCDLLTQGDGIRYINCDDGEVRNTRIESKGNGACWNTNFDPPRDVPIRRFASPAVREVGNTYVGFREARAVTEVAPRGIPALPALDDVVERHPITPRIDVVLAAMG